MSEMNRPEITPTLKSDCVDVDVDVVASKSGRDARASSGVARSVDGANAPTSGRSITPAKKSKIVDPATRYGRAKLSSEATWSSVVALNADAWNIALRATDQWYPRITRKIRVAIVDAIALLDHSRFPRRKYCAG